MAKYPKRRYTIIDPRFSAISLGWGVQSWTMVAMSALGALPKADFAIHSDTRHEREATYRFIEENKGFIEASGIKYINTAAENSDTLNRYDGTFIPAFTLIEDRTPKIGQITRQCTQNWKINPFVKAVRDELNRRDHKLLPNSVEAWIGISKDEFLRAKPSRIKYVTNRFPLLELDMTREDCIRWLKDHDLPVPPRSACVFCPFTNKAAWQDLKRQKGADWEKAVAVDEQIRHIRPPHALYLSSKCVPLDQAIFLPEQVELDSPFIETDDANTCDSGYCFI